MNGTKLLLFVVVIAMLLHEVVKSDEELGSVAEERGVDDAAMEREVMERLAALSDADEDEMEKRSVEKRWFRARRAWKRIKRAAGRYIARKVFRSVVGK